MRENESGLFVFGCRRRREGGRNGLKVMLLKNEDDGGVENGVILRDRKAAAESCYHHHNKGRNNDPEILRTFQPTVHLLVSQASDQQGKRLILNQFKIYLQYLLKQRIKFVRAAQRDAKMCSLREEGFCANEKR